MNALNSTMSAPTFPAAPPFGYPDLPSLVSREPEVAPVTVPAPEVSKVLLDRKAMLIYLGFTQIGRTRQVKEGEVKLAQNGEEDGEGLVEANTDRDLARVVKTLFKCVEIKRIEALDNEVRSFIKRKCLPSPLRANSVYLVPMGLVPEVNAQLVEYAATREQLVAEFVRVYPRLLVRMRRQLRDLFDRHDYPSRDNVRACFAMRWRFFAMQVPGALSEISADVWESERAKAASDWAAAQEEIQQVLRVRLKSMVEHLADRLKPEADGKKKIFRNTAVTNMTDFLNDFSALNITDDAELARIVESARSLMTGVDAQTLRDSKKTRETIQEGVARLESQLTTLIVDKPKRLITFDD